jgi:hypothetical protein
MKMSSSKRIAAAGIDDWFGGAPGRVDWIGEAPGTIY